MSKQKDAKVLVGNKIVKRHVYFVHDDAPGIIQINKRYYQVVKAIPEISANFVLGQQLSRMESNIFWEAYEGINATSNKI